MLVPNPLQYHRIIFERVDFFLLSTKCSLSRMFMPMSNLHCFTSAACNWFRFSSHLCGQFTH